MVLSGSTATNYGGVMYFENVKTVSIVGWSSTSGYENSFTTFSAGIAGSFMYSVASTLDLTLQDNVFTAISSAYTEATLMTQIATNVGDRGGMFYIKDPGTTCGAMTVTST